MQKIRTYDSIAVMGFKRTRVSFLLAAVCVFLFASVAVAVKKKPLLHPINLNTATAAELQQVPGIGPSTADKILKMRKSYGPFKSVDDLRAIKGIGPKRIEKMRKYLTVGKPPVQKKPASPAVGKRAPSASNPPPS